MSLPNKFSKTLDEMGISIRSFARKIDVSDTSVKRWIRGDCEIPPKILEWIEKAEDFYKQNPWPKKS